MMQRTTIAAEDQDLETLRREAERRKVSFAQLMSELVAEKASELRRARRPRFGLGEGGGGVAMASVDDEDAPARGGS